MLAAADPFAVYRRDLEECRPVGAEAEAELAAKMRAGCWNRRKRNGHPAGPLAGKAVTAERLPDGRYSVTVELRKGRAARDSERVGFGMLDDAAPARPRKPR